MTNARTLKTLVVLLVSMTVTTLVLVRLRTDRVHAPTRSLMAAADSAGPEALESLVRWTDVPLRDRAWRNIIIHAAAPRDAVVSQCHFLIDATERPGWENVRATKLWRRQGTGRHVHVPGHDYNTDSIAICLIGDFSARPPGDRQFRALVDLARLLQSAFAISESRVYLHRDLAFGSEKPGRAFPASAFAAALRRDVR